MLREMFYFHLLLKLHLPVCLYVMIHWYISLLHILAIHAMESWIFWNRVNNLAVFLKSKLVFQRFLYPEICQLIQSNDSSQAISRRLYKHLINVQSISQKKKDRLKLCVRNQNECLFPVSSTVMLSATNSWRYEVNSLNGLFLWIDVGQNVIDLNLLSIDSNDGKTHGEATMNMTSSL